VKLLHDSPSVAMDEGYKGFILKIILLFLLFCWRKLQACAYYSVALRAERYGGFISASLYGARVERKYNKDLFCWRKPPGLCLLFYSPLGGTVW